MTVNDSSYSAGTKRPYSVENTTSTLFSTNSVQVNVGICEALLGRLARIIEFFRSCLSYLFSNHAASNYTFAERRDTDVQLRLKNQMNYAQLQMENEMAKKGKFTYVD